ncbi:MAG: ATP-dependent metallopeptidase FtsH/Yme1/Tma family protein [Sedimentibacter sp.]
MNEVKTPKKPLIYYYGIVLMLLMLFNFLALPLLAQRQIQEVDYSTFMTMTENMQIGQVEVQDNQIIFTDKENTKIYRTGIMNDPDLVDRLHLSSSQFTSEIVQEMSPFLNFLLSWILPIIIFSAIGQSMQKKMMNKAGGGGNSMMFGMGKSNAKIYVKSKQVVELVKKQY